MKFLILFLTALVALRLTFPPTGEVALEFSYGVIAIQALIFSGITWAFGRRSKDTEGWIIAGGWMSVIVALMRYGTNYQAAKGRGLSSDDATMVSLSDWTGPVALIGAAAIIYATWRRRSRLER